ncbi:MAG: class I SAM-dependent methyltransferase [Propionibacteriaceae bacterium]|nr:class I SAM-dependent methyltransferase [Propionibacteriaceae bacterium]
MSHYFETPTADEKRYEFPAVIWGRQYGFTSSSGVFSSTRLDLGTSVLFRLTEPPQDRQARMLDLGCGFGAIAVALATECPSVLVDAVDVNQRALGLTQLNAETNGVSDQVRILLPDEVTDDTAYDEIWSNPPIRIGKKALHEMLDLWLERLTPTGTATLVVAKNLGADSLHEWLESRGWLVARLGSAKGFRVLRTSRQVSSR